MKLFEQLGRVALGSRIRYLSEKITEDAGRVYGLYGIEMNPKWFPVFFMLSQNHEQTITAIAKDIGHSHVSVSKIVTEMSRAGLVKSKVSAKDRRQSLVSLSKAGERIAARIEDQYLDLRAAMDEVSKQSKHDLWKAMEEWEILLQQKSIFDRVREKKQRREGHEIKIVPYKAKYREAFRRLNEEWITTYFKMEQADHDALDAPEDYILKRGGYIFVATLDDKPVGVCALLKRKDPVYPFELAKMAVSPEVRGMGAGWLLGQAVVEKARALKAKSLYLESNTILKPAIGLYRKLGFKKVEGPETPYERCNIQMELRF